MKAAIRTLAFAVAATLASGDVDGRRSRLEWDLTPGPVEGSTRPQDEFFDRTARIRVHLFAREKSRGAVQAQFLFFYDDVSSTGKVLGKVEAQERAIRIARAGDHAAASDPFRLSGKITKKGTLTGMRWVGCGARVYEGGRLVFEDYRPSTARALAAKVARPVGDLGRGIPPSAVVSAKKPAPPLQGDPSARPNDRAAEEGALTLLGSTFSSAEAKAALEAVNRLSEEDLVGKVGLSRAAAKHLAAARPIAALADLPKITYVKATALAALKRYVSIRENP